MKQCTITVYGRKVDVVEIYKRAGFTEPLPATLTLRGRQLKVAGEVPWNYRIQRSSDSVAIGDSTAVIVNNGDEFHAVPPAIM